MAKSKTEYVCNQCGANANKWAGQCAECLEWNSMQAFVVESGARRASVQGYAGASARQQIVNLENISLQSEIRSTTGNPELDRVLGGGLVEGSVVLIGGDPGIGKSTLLLQFMASVPGAGNGLYITGEESLQQVAMRAKRLGLPLEGLRCLAETQLERILEHVVQEKPRVIVVDSIQTVFTEQLQSAPGSVAQVRETAAGLVRFAKQTHTAIFLVGHVTKDGSLAGPRVLEHMVDAVLYFEGDSGGRYRVIRAMKNRFGAVNELGVFAMTDTGLKPVSNPSAIFLSSQSSPKPGSIVTVTREGTRPILLEVQALVDQSHLSNPRRLAIGLEQNRLGMQLAILHKHAGVAAFDQDVFANVVGGMRISETGSDLAIMVAIISSMRNQSPPDGLVVFGEVGLNGEVRPVHNGEERLLEASKHGFKIAIIPKGNKPRKSTYKGMKIHAVEALYEAVEIFRDL